MSDDFFTIVQVLDAYGNFWGKTFSAVHAP